MQASHSHNAVYGEICGLLPQLRRYAYVLTRDPTRADDLVQECVVRALDRSHQYRPGTNLRAWLFTILHNLYVSDMRGQSRRGHVVDIDDVIGLSCPPSQEDRVALTTVIDAVEALPPMQRRAVELVGFAGLSYEQTSRIMDLPIGTLKSRVSRARTQLRRALVGAWHGRKEAEVSFRHGTAATGHFV